jgi:hypothetical protein
MKAAEWLGTWYPGVRGVNDNLIIRPAQAGC